MLRMSEGYMDETLHTSWYSYVRGLLLDRLRTLCMAHTLAKTACIWVAALGLCATLSAQTHQVTIGWTETSQPAGTTVTSVTVQKNGTTVATLPVTTLQYQDTGILPGQTYEYTVTNNFASSGALSTPQLPVSLPVVGAQSLFTTQTPVQVNQSDGPSTNYELGMKFQASVAGQITAIRFWKDSKEVGTHTGRVWSSTGTQLGSIIFTNETASGWQQASLVSPISVLPNTTYIVSVNTAGTYYVDNTTGFATKITNGNLSSVVGGNGVYGTVGVLPTNTYQSSNYFRDIVFVPGSTPPPPPTMSTTCIWLVGGTAWQCTTDTVNVPSGTPIKSVVTSGTLTNTTNGTLP